jgi:hypothetical protein
MFKNLTVKIYSSDFELYLEEPYVTLNCNPERTLLISFDDDKTWIEYDKTCIEIPKPEEVE